MPVEDVKASIAPFETTARCSKVLAQLIFFSTTVSQAKTMLSNKNLPSIRLLVIGDSGVGKTSLVSRITQDKLPSSTQWTQQANIEIMMHSCAHRPYFVEFMHVLSFFFDHHKVLKLLS